MNAGAQSKPQEPVETDLRIRIQNLEAEVGGLRQELADALAAEEHLNGELRVAVEKLSELLRQRPLPNGSGGAERSQEIQRNWGLQLGRLESRMRSVELRLERVTGQVASILESRIWRTLVKGSGFLLKFVR